MANLYRLFAPLAIIILQASLVQASDKSQQTTLSSPPLSTHDESQDTLSSLSTSGDDLSHPLATATPAASLTALTWSEIVTNALDGLSSTSTALQALHQSKSQLEVSPAGVITTTDSQSAQATSLVPTIPTVTRHKFGLVPWGLSSALSAEEPVVTLTIEQNVRTSTLEVQQEPTPGISTSLVATLALPTTIANTPLTSRTADAFTQGNPFFPGLSAKSESENGQTIMATHTEAVPNPSSSVSSLTTVVALAQHGTSIERVASPLALTIQSLTASVDATQAVVQGQTVALGSSVVIGSGIYTTMVVMRTQSAGELELVVGDATTVISASTTPPPALITAGGQTLSRVGDQFLVQSKTLALGHSITLGSGTLTTLVAVMTDKEGHTALVVGGSVTTLAQPITALTSAGLTAAAAESRAVVVNGQTLVLGSAVVLGSGSMTTRMMYTTDRSGRPELVEGSTTLILGTSTSTGGYLLDSSGAKTSISGVDSSSSSVTALTSLSTTSATSQPTGESSRTNITSWRVWISSGLLLLLALSVE